MKRWHTVVLATVLLAAAASRLGVVAAIPGFFGPGDSSIYYAAARGCLSHGVPRIDFVWNFATTPPRIAHIEDYCEPAFAYLLAAPMALLGGGIVAAKLLAVACGTFAAWLAFRFSRRFGLPTALLAAALVAFEPWSIYFGGLIMKEATVSVVALLFFAAARSLLAAPESTRSRGFRFGALTVVAGLVQYELLPVLATSIAAALWIHQRRLVWPYVAGTTVATLALLAVTWSLMGVPISAKVFYFLGRDFWLALPASTPPDPVGFASRFLPVKAAIGGIIGWYPVVLALAWLGVRDPRVHRTESTLLAAFGLSYVYFHAVPGSLWQRHFIPATAVFAPYAALGMGAVHGWQKRSWAPAATGALLAFAVVAPRAYALGARLVPGDMFPPGAVAAAIVAAGVGLPLVALHAARGRLPLARLRPFLPPLLVLGVALNYHASLPWPAIYGNPQYPGYQQASAQRERVCRRIRGVLAGASVMATAPGEVSLFADAPSVVLPDNPPAILMIQARYGIPYLLARDDILAPGVIEQVPVEPVLAVEGYTLYRFVRFQRPADSGRIDRPADAITRRKDHASKGKDDGAGPARRAALAGLVAAAD